MEGFNFPQFDTLTLSHTGTTQSFFHIFPPHKTVILLEPEPAAPVAAAVAIPPLATVKQEPGVDQKGNQEPGVELKAKVEPALPATTTLGLEQMVQDAVKKLLLGGEAATSGLLKSIDTSAILAKVKQEKLEEEEDDSDCIIEEEVPFSNVKTEPTESEGESPSKPLLYLPPVNCPVYKPTPKAELAGKGKIQGSTSRQGGLLQATSRAVPLVRKGKTKTSYKQPTAESVLGDLGDLSDSGDEMGETPDLLGSILK